MPDYKTMYLHLFNRVSDAVNALESMNLGQAKEILIHAQQESEELHFVMITVQKLLQDMKKLSILRDATRHLHFPCSISKSCIRK